MRNPLRYTTVALVVLVGAYVLHGQTQPETPKAVFEQCQTLRAQIDKADEGIREAEYQLQRERAAIANCEYVRARNAVLVRKLAEWAEAK